VTRLLKGASHISGSSGSGKTVLAVWMAARATKHGQVLWVNTDGKLTFVESLRKNISAIGGMTERLSIIKGHKQALDAVRSVSDLLVDDTCLVIIDPITRVLDLGRKNEIMWGRNLFENALPGIAGSTIPRGVSLVVTSEARQLDDETKAIHQNSINRFMDRELNLTRLYGSKTTTITLMNLQTMKESVCGSLEVTPEGIVRLEIMDIIPEVNECSGEQCV
jgi:hypothetical protein